ncbi:SWIM zinc finger domain-containing protein [Blautia schinkii]|nr:SWIM zinc finger domain-containing protein [Blautia schinkii]
MFLFTSTKRFYITLICLIFAAVIPIQAATGRFSYPPAETAFMIIVYAAAGLAFVLPEILYSMTPTEKLLKRYDVNKDARPQIERQARARNGELTPRKIDVKSRCATFTGKKGGSYRTTLKSCTCPDFKERKAPCKHIYYLMDQIERSSEN